MIDKQTAGKARTEDGKLSFLSFVAAAVRVYGHASQQLFTNVHGSGRPRMVAGHWWSVGRSVAPAICGVPPLHVAVVRRVGR